MSSVASIHPREIRALLKSNTIAPNECMRLMLRWNGWHVPAELLHSALAGPDRAEAAEYEIFSDADGARTAGYTIGSGSGTYLNVDGLRLFESAGTHDRLIVDPGDEPFDYAGEALIEMRRLAGAVRLENTLNHFAAEMSKTNRMASEESVESVDEISASRGHDKEHDLAARIARYASFFIILEKVDGQLYLSFANDQNGTPLAAICTAADAAHAYQQHLLARVAVHDASDAPPALSIVTIAGYELFTRLLSMPDCAGAVINPAGPVPPLYIPRRYFARIAEAVEKD
ncbi:MAG: hypothetical protein KDK27_03845 [Leptospiraceae bacterium]|nr:hypothetical protein [Leptospiraceae bacterium]